MQLKRQTNTLIKKISLLILSIFSTILILIWYTPEILYLIFEINLLENWTQNNTEFLLNPEISKIIVYNNHWTQIFLKYIYYATILNFPIIYYYILIFRLNWYYTEDQQQQRYWLKVKTINYFLLIYYSITLYSFEVTQNTTQTVPVYNNNGLDLIMFIKYHQIYLITTILAGFFCYKIIQYLVNKQLFKIIYKILLYTVLILVLYNNTNIYEYFFDLVFLVEYTIILNFLWKKIYFGKNGIRTHAQFIKTE